ncbi:OLC1v1013129C1 [Oldenlandia corymbosa var. corymbosa]|uniref:OLC1v1013129C1 n=1 Tax=Oldenlandia corymbosa var. corymbosa TaxID=529605 RepID=A0AAV1DXJ6_OLDCO|nr:OLC1v1013129C1 [Oldenlandia corymbosa var. corymbosa]
MEKEYSSMYNGSFFGTSERLIVSQGVIQKSSDRYSVRPGSFLRRIQQSRVGKDDGRVKDLDVTTRVPVVASQKKVIAPVPVSLKQSSSARKDDDVNRLIRENKPKVAAVVPKEVSRRPPSPEARRPMKRPTRHYDDEEEDENANALRMMREMTGYDPRTYTDRGDDRNMEASFHDIEKEERKSAKLGRKKMKKSFARLQKKNGWSGCGRKPRGGAN